MNPTETALVILLAGLGTAIALGFVEAPPAILHSSVSQAFLLIMTLVLFAYSPVVGIAAIALFAILMFKRNVQKTSQYYGAASVRAYHDQQTLAAATQQQGPHITAPRYYSVQDDMGGHADGFQNTSSNRLPNMTQQTTRQPMQRPVAQPPTVRRPNTTIRKTGLPESFDMEEPFASPEEVGTYPLGDPRPESQVDRSFTAMYRPTEDMGDNTFVYGEGPNMDQKMQSFAY